MAKPTGAARTRRSKTVTKAKRRFLERIQAAPNRGTVVWTREDSTSVDLVIAGKILRNLDRRRADPHYLANQPHDVAAIVLTILIGLSLTY